MKNDLFDSVPESVRKDIDKVKQFASLSDLDELRLMMCLDIWVKEWKLIIKGTANGLKDT